MDSITPNPRLRDQFRAVIRVNHYSIRTEKTYWYWIGFYIRFHTMRHPLERGPSDVNAFLSWLAIDRQVAAATQNLALNAIVFLYARVLEQPLGDIGETIRVKRPPRVPVVLTHVEAMGIIGRACSPPSCCAGALIFARADVAGSCGCTHYADLYACTGSGLCRCAEPPGLSFVQARFRPTLFTDKWKQCVNGVLQGVQAVRAWGRDVSGIPLLVSRVIHCGVNCPKRMSAKLR